MHYWNEDQDRPFSSENVLHVRGERLQLLSCVSTSKRSQQRSAHRSKTQRTVHCKAQRAKQHAGFGRHTLPAYNIPAQYMQGGTFLGLVQAHVMRRGVVFRFAGTWRGGRGSRQEMCNVGDLSWPDSMYGAASDCTTLFDCLHWTKVHKCKNTNRYNNFWQDWIGLTQRIYRVFFSSLGLPLKCPSTENLI